MPLTTLCPLYGVLRRIVAMSCLVAALPGCTIAFQIKNTVPTPLITPLPIDAAVYYPISFRQYEYRQESSDGSVSINQIGQAQQQLFNQLFSSLFNSVKLISDLDIKSVHNLSTDVIIVLTVDDYAVTSPRDNGLDFYEATIRYGLSLHNAHGELIAAWSINGYGRDRRRAFVPFRAAAKATEEAMRDAATLIAVELGATAEIQSVICKKFKTELDCLSK